MDIWAWVWDIQETLQEKGYHSLSTHMYKLPYDTVEGNHQEIDQYIDSLVMEARQSGFTWVELFLRHWYLQSKILHRGEPKDAIKEAVSLLEFSHREENRDCPQSVCVVQDLASCYGQFDGSGYAEQRLAVAAEGLEKINPDWPCYKCISAEYAEALNDAGRHEECLAFLDKTDQTYLQYGHTKDTSDLLLVRVMALMRLGKHAEARKQGEKLQSWGGGSNFELDAITLRALNEALDNNHQQALTLLPDIEKILKEDSSLTNWWAETMTHVIKADTTQQTEKNIQRLLSLAELMNQRGTYRQAFDTYAGILSLDHLFPNTLNLQDIFSAMLKIREKLHQDCGATETFRQLKAQHKAL